MLNQKSKAKLIDWQTWGIGVGCQDIAYMIGMWFFPDYRHLIEKDLIKRYHDNLLKFGINNYSWDNMMDYWVSFARNGDPNCEGLSKWPSYRADKRSTMIFDTKSELINAPFEYERVAWKELLY